MTPFFNWIVLLGMTPNRRGHGLRSKALAVTNTSRLLFLTTTPANSTAVQF